MTREEREQMAKALIQYAHFDGQMAGLEFEEIAAELRSMDWQPIETAPKDGTSIILCVGDDIVGEARWIGEGSDEGWWWAGNDPGDYHGGKIETEPTVWQPLPLPPANTEGGSE